jgi:hypothetical protein
MPNPFLRLLKLPGSPPCCVLAPFPPYPCPQGIYVLQDNNFRWLARVAPTTAGLSGPAKQEHLAKSAAPLLFLPCGILRGERQLGSSGGLGEGCCKVRVEKQQCACAQVGRGEGG